MSEQQRQHLEQRVYKRWSKAARRRGFAAPSRRHGVRLDVVRDKKDRKALAGYLTKGQLSGIAGEITGGQVVKQAKGGNRTPFQILADIGEHHRPEDVALWHEWERASKNRRQMSWSKGAKDALLVDDLDDEQLLAKDDEQFDESAYVVATVPAGQWSEICSNVELRCEVIEVVRSAVSARDAMQLAGIVLSSFGVDHGLECTAKTVEKLTPEERREVNQVKAKRGAAALFSAVKERPVSLLQLALFELD